MLKKSCKNECICPAYICLSNVITSSRISLIIFFHKIIFCLIGRLKVTPVYMKLDKIRKSYILLSNFDRIRKSTLFLLSYYSIESIRHNSLKVYKFLKTGVHGKDVLVSSRTKFAIFES